MVKLCKHMKPIPWLASWVRKYLKRTFIGLIGSAGAGLLGVLIARLAREAISSIGGKDFHTVAIVCALGIAAYTLKGLFSYCSYYFLGWVAHRIGMEIRELLLSRLLFLPLPFFHRRHAGDLISRVVVDVRVIEETLPAVLERIFVTPILVIAFMVRLFMLNWQLFLFSVIAIPLLGYVIDLAGKKMRRIQVEIQQRFGDINNRLEHFLSFVKEVKGLCAEELERKRFSTTVSQTFGAIMRGIRLRALLIPLIELAGAIGVVFIILFASWQIIKAGSNFNLGKLTEFIILLQMLYQNLRNWGEVIMNLQQSAGAASRLLELLEPTIQEEKEGVVELPSFQRELKFSNVSLSYNGTAVLEGINLEIKKGEMIAIVGPSGAGKTSLVDLIPRFFEPKEGEIRIDDWDIREVKIPSLRKQIAIVSQEPLVFAGTIRENLSYANEVSEEEMRSALEKVGLWEFVASLPEGLDTYIGEKGVTLSAGQKQRLAIARALLRKPSILILDEATANLDSISEQALLNNLSRGEQTIVLVAHRLSTARVADRIVVLDKGRIVEEGTHKELLEKGGLYAKLYELQMREEDEKVS